MKIDRHAAAALAVLALIWLACLGMNVHMFNQWMSGVPKHANDWQGCLFMTLGLLILPFYARLMMKPPQWVTAPVRTR